jgi:GNAT superfamily N-acetyltransferase
MSIALHKGYLPGCIGRVADMHAQYYSREAGFGLPFESKVARELAEFCGRYNEQRDGLWLATGPAGVQGSIVIDGLAAADAGAHLRWFITSDSVRGSGTGKALLGAAMAFCREREYHRVYLWTFEGLGAARHLYEQAGFRLVEQHRGSQWGAEVEEQRFELRT